jgi:hypothetical protein
VERAFIVRTEVQPVKGDGDIFLRSVCRTSPCRSLSVDGSWIANERVKEQAHIFGETHPVGVRDPFDDDRDAKGHRVLDNRSLLPHLLEAAHNRIEPHGFVRRELVSRWILVGRIGHEPSFMTMDPYDDLQQKVTTVSMVP